MPVPLRTAAPPPTLVVQHRAVNLTLQPGKPTKTALD